MNPIILAMKICWLSTTGMLVDCEYYNRAYDHYVGAEMFSTHEECNEFKLWKLWEVTKDGALPTMALCAGGKRTNPQLPEGWNE